MHRTLLVVPILVLLAACGGSTSAADKIPPGTIKVVAAENVWGNIAAQIGGAHAHVTSMISDPSVDPHQFESSVAEAASLAEARVVIQNGLGYDEFIKQLLANTSNPSRTELTVANVLHANADANPHLWYDIPRVPEVAAAIAQEFATANPAAKADLDANLKAFDATLQPVLDTLNTITTKYAHAPVAYTERVPQYLVHAANLDDRTPPGFAQAIEDGTEPSPADMQAMNDLMTNRRIKALLYNVQAESAGTRHVRDLAHSFGIPVVNVTESLPPSEPNFQTWQLHQVQALLAALGGTP